MMENTRIRSVRIKSNIAAVLALVWMCVIFSFSAQTKEESGAVSQGLSYRMIDTTGRLLHLHLDDERIREIAGAIEHFVRKGAHMTEYAILTLLLYGWLCRWDMSSRRRAVIAAVAAALYACSDEFHQTFVPGRAGRVGDVLVDSAGVLLGLALFFLIGKLVRERKVRKE